MKLTKLLGYQSASFYRYLHGHYSMPILFRVRVNMLAELAGLPAPFVIDLEANQYVWLDSILLEFEQAINRKKHRETSS